MKNFTSQHPSKILFAMSKISNSSQLKIFFLLHSSMLSFPSFFKVTTLTSIYNFLFIFLFGFHSFFLQGYITFLFSSFEEGQGFGEKDQNKGPLLFLVVGSQVHTFIYIYKALKFTCLSYLSPLHIYNYLVFLPFRFIYVYTTYFLSVSIVLH